MPYLIDGHNLIPKIGLQLDSADDESELIELLLKFARVSRRSLEVFFDGAPAHRAETQKIGAIIAHFVRRGSSADSAIRARLHSMGREARNWTVVSSDREVADAARRAHAEVLNSQEFAGLVRQALRTKPADTQPESPPDDDVEAWMKLFSERRDKRAEES